MATRPIETRSNEGKCYRCSNPRPPGNSRYCGDECNALARADRERERQSKRRSACVRCGGEKGPGPRGSRMCEECRRMAADASGQYRQEYERRRRLAATEERLARGEQVRSRRDPAPAGRKWCARCQDFRPLGSFAARKATGKHVSYCKPCQRSYNRERRVKLQFGLTWDEYEMLMEVQDHRCAICSGQPRKNVLAIDHDHTTGEVRGLLCSRCNHRLLGSANDDPARLRRAADYLEEFGPRDVFGLRKFVPGFATGDEPLFSPDGETAVREFITSNGGPMPGVLFKIKWGSEARNTELPEMGPWLAETETERVNAGADIGVLVIQRRGYAPTRAGHWRAIVSINDLGGALPLGFPVEMELRHAARWLRTLGFGEPLADADVKVGAA